MILKLEHTPELEGALRAACRGDDNRPLTLRLGDDTLCNFYFDSVTVTEEFFYGRRALMLELAPLHVAGDGTIPPPAAAVNAGDFSAITIAKTKCILVRPMSEVRFHDGSVIRGGHLGLEIAIVDDALQIGVANGAWLCAEVKP